MFLHVVVYVNGQYVKISKCVIHLGHSIYSCDSTEVVKSVTRSYCSGFNNLSGSFWSTIFVCFLGIAFRRCKYAVYNIYVDWRSGLIYV